MTQQALPYILTTFPGGREVVTYSSDAEFSPDKHYVLIEPPTNGWEAAPKLAERGFKPYLDYYDKTNPHLWGLPVDWEYHGTRIGKCTFFGLGELSPNMDMSIALFFESIGRFCSINETAFFQHNHPMNMIGTGRFQQMFAFDKQMKYLQRAKEDPNNINPSEKLTIGNDVWIGANTFINTSKCSGIGDGAIIAAGAVVNSDVPPYAIVAGVPGNIKKYRYTPEQIEILLRVKWWDWDDETIDANSELLLYPDLFFERFK
ncbi:MAG: CatB-related O-acetyltransferase [Oscillospiraceae bacterium]|jgi:acetyltransferase-like isoleucine patch superfamily enzyme|nr:CatB-related O-acetyltransferase [Oscillospiraceae bacterium]